MEPESHVFRVPMSNTNVGGIVIKCGLPDQHKYVSFVLESSEVRLPPAITPHP